MDAFIKKRLRENNCNFKRSLDRIIDQYSNIQDEDEDMVVDMNNIKEETLQRYYSLGRSKLKQQSQTDESLSVLDLTKQSQLDFTYQDDGVDETALSTSQSFGEDEMSKSDTIDLTGMSSERERNISETEHLPEDLDQELEQSLRSHGSSFVELYPSMINRIERAWHRQNVSEAADSVLRRYHRWRKQANKSNINVTLKHTSSKPRKRSNKILLGGKSPEKRQFIGTESASRSPFQLSTSLQSLQAQQPCPEKKRRSPRRDRHQQVVAMDLSGEFETSKPKEVSLNKTFTVAEFSNFGEKPCSYAASPSRSSAKTSNMDQSLRSKRLSLSGYREQATDCSMYAPEDAPFQDRPDIYGSPVRTMHNLSRSPHPFPRSPKESFSREPLRPRSLSTSLSSPPQNLLRIRHLQNTHLPLPPQLQSAKPATAGRLQRHLSFDSALPSNHVSRSQKKVDEEIVKLYHTLVCQNKSSPVNAFPCRLCEKAPEVGVDCSSSSSLAALALSPHRSILRKRHRDWGCDDRPLSKRFREEYCTSSPGSKRYRNDLLRRRLARSEFPQSDDLYTGSSKHSMFNKFNSQRPSTYVQ